jgi:hypothetical protein
MRSAFRSENSCQQISALALNAPATKGPGVFPDSTPGNVSMPARPAPEHGFARKNSATRVGGRILSHGWTDDLSPRDDHDPWTGTFWFGPGLVTVQRLRSIRNPSSDAGA